MEFLLVTGMSGAGKSRAIDALEDIGFFCVDNLPPELILTFYALSEQAGMERVAVVTDIRGGKLFGGLLKTLEEMKAAGNSYRILFFDADDDVLIHRYKETRRKHPLANQFLGSVEQAVATERNMLRPIRDMADYIFDTSLISSAQLKNRITGLFFEETGGSMSIQCISFGFKHGLPKEADLVFDVRCLPNPFYVEELRELTGLDKLVFDYVMQAPETKGFVTRLFDLVDYMVPLYVAEGKSQLVIAIGCTGGHHRSVAVAQSLCDHLCETGSRAVANHRDIRKQQ